MATALYGAIESGLIFAIMALGVYLSFRVLAFADLTVDGSFVTGGAVCAILILHGANPFVATLAGGVAGFFAGCLTGLLHTVGRVNSLLSGILIMTALYSINLRIMTQPNIPLMNNETVFTRLGSWWSAAGIDSWLSKPFAAMGWEKYAPRTFMVILCMILFLIVIKWLYDWLLYTELGLALRATGDNARMVRSLSANTNIYIVLGLGLSNGLVALSGAIMTQYNGFGDVNMGVGMIVIGLASVIIGEGLFGAGKVWRATLAVILGAVIYRIIIALALRVEFVDASDMKLITAIIVVIALTFPMWGKQLQERRKRYSNRKQMLQTEAEGGASHAATETNS